MVTSYRGKLTTDGSVSRRLREFNAGKHDRMSDVILRWDVVDDGVYRITRMDPKPVEGSAVVYSPPPEQMSPEFKPVDREGGYSLF